MNPIFSRLKRFFLTLIWVILLALFQAYTMGKKISNSGPEASSILEIQKTDQRSFFPAMHIIEQDVNSRHLEGFRKKSETPPAFLLNGRGIGS